MILDGLVEEIKETPKGSFSGLTLEQATNIAKAKLEKGLGGYKIPR